MKILESLKKRSCPICGSTDLSNVRFEQNIDESRLGKLPLKVNVGNMVAFTKKPT